MDENAKTDAPDSASAQSEPTGTTTAPEQSAPQKSAAETKLEGQLTTAKAKGDDYKKERDAARKDLKAVTSERDTARQELQTVTSERDTLKLENEGLKRPKVETTEAQASADAPQATEPSREAEVKELLKRNGLPTAWLLPDDSICFSEAHAKHVAGEAFDSLITISAE